jgi:hypothetical protein
LRHFKEISLELRLPFRERVGQEQASGGKNVLILLTGILFSSHFTGLNKLG